MALDCIQYKSYIESILMMLVLEYLLIRSEKIRDRISLVAASISGIAAFILYESTNASGFYWGDAGEFMAVSKVLGIGHAYGHPLFWLLGRISMLLAPSNPADAMNTLVALFSAASCALITLIIMEWMDTKHHPTQRLIVSVSISGLFMTSLTFWTQASYTEVYNVQTFFVALSILHFQRYVFQKNRISSLIISAFFFGLSVTLGMYVLILLLIPAIYFLFSWNKIPNRFSTLFLAGLFCILGLTVWLYLPLRSALHPPFLYSRIDSLRQFWDYLSRADFMTPDLAGTAGVKYVLGESVILIYKNIGAWGFFLILAVIPGIIRFRKNLPLLSGFILTAITFYSVSVLLLPRTLTFFQMIGMEVYFIPLYLVLLPVMTIGANWLLAHVRTCFVFLFLIPAMTQLMQNIQDVNISKADLAPSFKSYLVETIPPDATVHPRSDELLHPLFFSSILENAPDYGILPPRYEKESYSDLVNGNSQNNLYFEVDRHFIQTVKQINRFHLAGPLVTAHTDSTTIQALEHGFVERFSFNPSEVNTLTRQDRFTFGMLWMNRAAYWFNRYKRSEQNQNGYRQNALAAYTQAALLDDFSYLGAFSAAMLSQMLLESNQTDQAEVLANKSIGIHPFIREAWLTRYGSAVRKQNYQEAVHILQRIIQDTPGNPGDYLELSRLMLYLKNKRKAIQYYHQGIRNGAPPDSALGNKLGIH